MAKRGPFSEVEDNTTDQTEKYKGSDLKPRFRIPPYSPSYKKEEKKREREKGKKEKSSKIQMSLEDPVF